MLERAFDLVGREEIFAQTGLQFMPINTLYQLLAMQAQQSPLLDVAESFLMMPDLFHWLLTGEKCERVHRRHHHAILQPYQRRLGHRSAEATRLADGISSGRSFRRATTWDRSAANWRPRRACTASRSCCPARTTRPAP